MTFEAEVVAQEQQGQSKNQPVESSVEDNITDEHLAKQGEKNATEIESTETSTGDASDAIKALEIGDDKTHSGVHKSAVLEEVEEDPLSKAASESVEEDDDDEDEDVVDLDEEVANAIAA